jgi:hypothetical protein
MKVRSLFTNIFATIGFVTSLCLISYAYNFFNPESVNVQRDLFDWTIVDEYPNEDNSVVAVLEYGITNTGANTAPFYRLKLKAQANSEYWLNNRNVWNSQVQVQPIITWLNTSTVELSQYPSTIWDYNPSIKLNEHWYNLQIKVLPKT